MASMMRDVVRHGTGRRALALGRNDLAGKTGTTNDFRDAWFSGFNDDVVTTVWVGFDDSRTLGRGEAGSSAALPIWVDYMEEALEGVPESGLPRPDNIVAVSISPESGAALPEGAGGGITEYFRVGMAPAVNAAAARTGTSPATAQPDAGDGGGASTEGLF
jgi:penicillin-binding protein 1A